MVYVRVTRDKDYAYVDVHVDKVMSYELDAVVLIAYPGFCLTNLLKLFPSLKKWKTEDQRGNELMIPLQTFSITVSSEKLEDE